MKIRIDCYRICPSKVIKRLDEINLPYKGEREVEDFLFPPEYEMESSRQEDQLLIDCREKELQN